MADFQPDRDYFPHKTKLLYADRFQVSYHKSYKVVTVTGAWEGAPSMKYALVQCGAPIPAGFDQVIEIPVHSMAALSTTYLSHFGTLGVTDRLKAVSRREQINDQQVHTQISQGKTVEVGGGSTLNRELLLSLGIDVIFTYGTGNPQVDGLANLESLPLAIVAEYRETSPLARTEWLKYFALFFNQEALADAHFLKIVSNYEKLKQLVAPIKQRPTVFAGFANQGTWFAPGGQSYVAQFFRDAGADYVFTTEPSVGGIPLSFEAVFARAAGADFWLNGNQDWHSLADVRAADERYGGFAAYQQKRVFVNNNRLNKTGGNDYWESGIANPDLVLSDLIKIFHPELMPNHSLVYYKRLP
jgi:iron complex transport system substrate-binding protein